MILKTKTKNKTETKRIIMYITSQSLPFNGRDSATSVLNDPTEIVGNVIVVELGIAIGVELETDAATQTIVGLAVGVEVRSVRAEACAVVRVEVNNNR